MVRPLSSAGKSVIDMDISRAPSAEVSTASHGVSPRQANCTPSPHRDDRRENQDDHSIKPRETSPRLIWAMGGDGSSSLNRMPSMPEDNEHKDVLLESQVGLVGEQEMPSPSLNSGGQAPDRNKC